MSGAGIDVVPEFQQGERVWLVVTDRAQGDLVKAPGPGEGLRRANRPAQKPAELRLQQRWTTDAWSAKSKPSSRQ